MPSRVPSFNKPSSSAIWQQPAMGDDMGLGQLASLMLSLLILARIGISELW